MNRSNKKHRAVSMIFVAVICMFFSLDPLEGSGDDSKYRLNKEFFNQFGRDIKDVATSPIRWQGKDLLKFSAVLGTGALMFCFDNSIQDWVRENKTEDANNAAEVLTDFGDGTLLGTLIIGSYLSGEIFRDEQLRKMGLLGAESLIVSTVLTYVLKISAGRARPYSGESSLSFHPFATTSRFHSFPSGHAAAAFSVATIIAEHSKKLWVDVLVYSLAGIVAATRVTLDKHYLSDVFIGSALGYFISKKISKLHHSGQSDRISVGVSLFPQHQALTFSYSF
jgi:membrane-associated phospholipid phosphatase